MFRTVPPIATHPEFSQTFNVIDQENSKIYPHIIRKRASTIDFPFEEYQIINDKIYPNYPQNYEFNNIPYSHYENLDFDDRFIDYEITRNEAKNKFQAYPRRNLRDFPENQNFISDFAIPQSQSLRKRGNTVDSYINFNRNLPSDFYSENRKNGSLGYENPHITKSRPKKYEVEQELLSNSIHSISDQIPHKLKKVIIPQRSDKKKNLRSIKQSMKNVPEFKDSQEDIDEAFDEEIQGKSDMNANIENDTSQEVSDIDNFSEINQKNPLNERYINPSKPRAQKDRIRETVLVDNANRQFAKNFSKIPKLRDANNKQLKSSSKKGENNSDSKYKLSAVKAILNTDIIEISKQPQNLLETSINPIQTNSTMSQTHSQNDQSTQTSEQLRQILMQPSETAYNQSPSMNNYLYSNPYSYSGYPPLIQQQQQQQGFPSAALVQQHGYTNQQDFHNLNLNYLNSIGMGVANNQMHSVQLIPSEFVNTFANQPTQQYGNTTLHHPMGENRQINTIAIIPPELVPATINYQNIPIMMQTVARAMIVEEAET
ncbi:hypothetical protein HK096_007525, partial [Nowakowskiella sp. JEL0078]